MESSSSSQAEAVAQANVRQFLDLGHLWIEGLMYILSTADGFINDDDADAGRPVNYHALNRALDANDNDSLFSDDEVLFSEPLDKATSVNSVAVGASGSALDQGSTGGQGLSLVLDEDNPYVKKYPSQEVWLVKCKRYREREVVRFIEGYKKNRPEDNIFSSSQSGSCGSGNLYIQTQDSPRAARALHNCVYIRRSRTLGLNGVDMTVLSDPIEIFSALSSSCSIAQVLNAHHEG
ncbi:hypothetical protein MPER_09584, partial [Moniliophthora perniciosa FA553]